MIDTFEKWVSKMNNTLNKGKKVSIIASPENTSGESMTIDLEAEKYMVRLSVWKSGGRIL